MHFYRMSLLFSGLFIYFPIKIELGSKRYDVFEVKCNSGIKMYTRKKYFYILWKKNSTKVDFSPISCKKSTILHSKWTLLKSCCFFLISLRSITNVAHDFQSLFLDIEIIIEVPKHVFSSIILFCKYKYQGISFF